MTAPEMVEWAAEDALRREDQKRGILSDTVEHELMKARGE